MRFLNKDRSLTLSVVAYEFPERDGKAEDFDYDANWLVLHGEYAEGGSVRSFDNSCLLTTELQSISAALKLIIGNVQDNFQSEFVDPYFELTIEALDATRFMVYASFAMLVSEDKWQNFGVESIISLQDLKTLSEDVEQAVKAFPVKE